MNVVLLFLKGTVWYNRIRKRETDKHKQKNESPKARQRNAQEEKKMKKTYASLLLRLCDEYVEHLTKMYHWDRRSDMDREDEVALKIRNDAAKAADAIGRILWEELDETEFEEMHKRARILANELYH